MIQFVYSRKIFPVPILALSHWTNTSLPAEPGAWWERETIRERPVSSEDGHPPRPCTRRERPTARPGLPLLWESSAEVKERRKSVSSKTKLVSWVSARRDWLTLAWQDKNELGAAMHHCAVKLSHFSFRNDWRSERKRTGEEGGRRSL